MSERLQYNSDGERLWLSPTIEITSDDGDDLLLTYLNTRIRLFGEDWEHLNHVEHIKPDGQLCGLTVTQDFMDTLMEHDFSYQFDEFPDAGTQEWYIQAQNRRLLEDLTEMENGISPD